MISRSELAELFAEDDRQRTLHAEWQAERAAQASPYMQRNDDAAGLLFRTIDNAPVPVPDSEEPPCFSETQADTLADLINQLRSEWAHDIDRRIGALQAENAELKGMIGSVLMMLGSSVPKSLPSKSDIIDLPDWRRRRDAA